MMPEEPEDPQEPENQELETREPENPQEPVEARVRPHRWIAWVWIVPIAALAVVVWLAWQALAQRGPDITISFPSAQGLQPGQSTIQHSDVVLGTVTSLRLTPDLRHVIVHARMSREAAPALTDSTIFYVVTPHVGVGGISGLSTLVSGAYIEMYPGSGGGNPRRNFVGLDSPPVVAPGTRGRAFTLVAPDLGSLTQGSPVTYRGVDVGVVTAFALAGDGHNVTVTAFVRAPDYRLVHPETRFWNAGGVAMTLGAEGLQVRANSWQQLLAGGVAFDTPPKSLEGAPSPDGSVFELYDNAQSAHGIASSGPPLMSDTLRNLHDVLQNLNKVLKNLDRVTSGPQLPNTLTSLNRLLTRLNSLASQAQPNINELLISLRATSAEAQRTLTAIQGATGGSLPSNTNLPQLMQQLAEAARSVRELADYLDQHPDALLRGRRAGSSR